MTKTKKKISILVGAICALLLTLFLTTGGLNNISASAAELSDYPNLTFTLINGGTEYSVKAANRNITEAIIPNKIGTKKVTQVAAGGFMLCTKLTTVEIPETVWKIGDSAFMDCSNLTDLVMWTNPQTGEGVQEIAEDAFSYCKLSNFVVPKTVVSVGDYSFEGNPRTGRMTVRNTPTPAVVALFASYPGEIVYNETDLAMTKKNDSKGNPYWQIDRGQSFPEKGRLEIPCFNTDGIPIKNICSSAFKFCELSLVENLTCSHGAIHTLNLESNAFYQAAIDEIILNNPITLQAKYEGSGESMNVFAESDLATISLPNTMNAISENMFSGCDKLTSIAFGTTPNRLGSNISYIGTQAFANCTSLAVGKANKLVIPASVTSTGTELFNDWVPAQYIELDFAEEPVAHGFDPDWCLNGDPSIIGVNQIQYFLNGGTNHPNNPDTYKEEDLPLFLEEPTRLGYEFKGWYGDPNFTTKPYGSVIPEGTARLWQVFAKWEIITYTIDYGIFYGSYHNNPKTYTVEDAITLQSFQVPGYNFMGWFEQYEGQGNKHTEISKGTTGNLAFYPYVVEKTWNECYNSVTGFWEIGTRNQLENLRNEPDAGFGRKYRLVASINLQSGQWLGPWVPIDNFKGTLDGNNFTISGFVIENVSGNIGFFRITSGTIQNLRLMGSLRVPQGSASVTAGLFAGVNSGTIQNCTASAGSNSPSMYCYIDNSSIGGICGLNSGNIINSVNYNSIYSYGNVGGIAGRNTGIIDSCRNVGEITYYYLFNSAGINYSVGGIVGHQTAGQTIYCQSTGWISFGGGVNGFDIRDNTYGPKVKPHIAAVIGYREGGTTSGNTFNCTFGLSTLGLTHSVQLTYAGYREIGRG